MNTHHSQFEIQQPNKQSNKNNNKLLQKRKNFASIYTLTKKDKTTQKGIQIRPKLLIHPIYIQLNIIQCLIVSNALPVSSSDFHSSEHFGVTTEDLNERAMHTTKLSVSSYLHGRLYTSHHIPTRGGLEVSFTVPQVMTQTLQRVIQGRLPPPYFPMIII